MSQFPAARFFFFFKSLTSLSVPEKKIKNLELRHLVQTTYSPES